MRKTSHDAHATFGETVDLAAKEPKRVQDLDALCNRWSAEQVPPLWK
jgi:hypothetical protein